jgi:hypothetical protein
MVTQAKSNIRKLSQKDPEFLIYDGLVVSTRAAIEISCRCPENYRDLIQECIGHGWIKPVAYVKDHELFWEALEK